MKNWRLALWAVVLPPVMAAALLLFGSVFPIRLDHRTLQHLARVEHLALPQGAGEVLYLSRDNGSAAGHVANFTLRHLAFPHGSWTWLVLKEHVCDAWPSGWLAVDTHGEFFRPDRPLPNVRACSPPESFAQRIGRAVVVSDSADVWDEFLRRIPELRNARLAGHVDAGRPPSALVTAGPRNEFRWARMVRLSVMLGAVLALVLLSSRLGTDSATGRICAAGIGFFAAVAIVLVQTYALGEWHILALAVEWFAGAMVWAQLTASGPKRETTLLLPGLAKDRFGLAAILLAAVVSLAVFLLRLDFDGDVFTHWLPMGRSFHHLKYHDPSSLMQQGSTHAATYPPGYGIFLATAMWAVDMTPTASFTLSSVTSLAIFLYRIAIWTLNIALLASLATYFATPIASTRQGPTKKCQESFAQSTRRAGSRQMTPDAFFATDTNWLWLASVAFMIGLFDTMSGRHLAAETLLFPMLAAAILAVLAGSKLDRPGLQLLGIAIAGGAMIVKWEAILLVAGIVAPWLAESLWLNRARWGRRDYFLLLLGIAFASLPALLWKSQLEIENDFFDRPNLAALWSARAEWVMLFIHSVTIVLKSGMWIPLAILLPVGLVLRVGRGIQMADLAVPVGVYLMYVLLITIYVFSNYVSPQLHMDQSLERLLLLPCFSCLLYSLESFRGSGAPAVFGNPRSVATPESPSAH